jgi:signal peptidase I
MERCVVLILVAVWLLALVLVGWVAVDAARRGRNWLAWALLVAFTGLVGAIAWLAMRRRAPIVEEPGAVRSVALRLIGVPLVFISVAVTTFVVTFLAQVARVDGRAMAPTIEDQDRLIINKLVYRLREPRRGEIVMLQYPLRPERTFVKRVVAEEGDQVRIIEGRVYVNDVAMTDSFVTPEYRSHDNWGPLVVPEGYYFVMGDHRNNSLDSRHWGFVPKKYILGRVRWRWWPFSAARAF